MMRPAGGSSASTTISPRRALATTTITVSLLMTGSGRSAAPRKFDGAIVIAPETTPAERRQVVRQRLAELENVFDYRLAIEPAAARLAAGQPAASTALGAQRPHRPRTKGP